MGPSKTFKRRMKVPECKIGTDFFYFLQGWGGKEVMGEYLIRATLRLWVAASCTCSEITTLFCLPLAGPIVPIHVHKHSAWCVHHLPQVAHKQLICFTNQQENLQVQGCSSDSGVKSMELSTPHPHPVDIYEHHFSATEYLPWMINSMYKAYSDIL